ncbi:MAG: LysM peptidoglycan-binding domain-containing protein [Syntrophomonadaceae bacterium]
MLYTVQAGDTLDQIAGRFGTTIESIMNANVICHPALLFTGQVLIIPNRDLALPKSGGGPYYLVLPEDTLHCLAGQFNTSVSVLSDNNQLKNPDSISAYTDLLVIPARPDILRLQTSWQSTPAADCTVFEPQRHGIYYIGSFLWAAFGLKALPPLLTLLEHPCPLVRYYTVLSLGRIARDFNGRVKRALKLHFNDPDPATAGLAHLALRRLRLAERGYRRTRLLTGDDVLVQDINFPAIAASPLASGSELIVLCWHIPSPTGEEGPRGGVLIYDQVQVIDSGRTGFLARRGDAQISFM